MWFRLNHTNCTYTRWVGLYFHMYLTRWEGGSTQGFMALLRICARVIGRAAHEVL